MDVFKKIKNRITSFVLAIVMLVTSMPYAALPAFSTDASTPGVTINYGGEKIDALTISDDEKKTVTAVTENADGLDLCWQIMHPEKNNRWIDIYGQNGETLDVSYSLISSMLNQNSKAVLRCILTGGEEVYSSQRLEVTLSYKIEETEPLLPTISSSSIPSSRDEQTDDEDVDPDEYTTHTIVINYLFDNQGIAFEPYGASIARGSDFYAEIDSPTVVGYTPFRRMGEDYVEAQKVVLDYKDVREDITINVIYEPALVEFKIHHHLQNVHDDEYSVTFDYITTSMALTGSVVGDGLALTEAQLPGFKALAYEHLTVAADGSTVIEIRYDRNYYLIDFDMNGGYGAEPVYTRYGNSVGTNDPTRHGYVFDGWELVSWGGHAPSDEQKSVYNINGHNVITVPDANLTYRARWITQQTTYTLVFWKENANDNGYTYWGYLDGLAALSGSYVSGSDRIKEVSGITDENYFTFNSEKTEKNVLIEGDGSTVINVYYTRKYYTLTIKATGACTIPVGHSHTDECYDFICDLGHVHTSDCTPSLSCKTPEHTAHTDECFICGMEEHTHGSAGCNCTLKVHTHSTSCYKDVGTKQSSPPKNAPSNPDEGEIYKRGTTYYIYIKGTWYKYNGRGASNGDVIDPTCGYSVEHTHGVNCSCPLPEHRHTENCYRDVIHMHTGSCYVYSCGDVEHTHGNACKRLHCGITPSHSHSNTCKSSSSTNTVKVIYRKYQQSIADIWPITDDNGVVYDDGERWQPSSSDYYSAVLVYLSDMPPDDFTLTLNKASYSAYTMNYYLQVLDGEAYTHKYNDKYYVLTNTIKAKYNYVTRDEDFFDIYGFYQSSSNPNFASNDQISISSSDKTVHFYYDRVTDHVLEFSSNGILLDTKSVYGIPYGQSLQEYNFIPDYPANLEPNAYTFGGWYTSPGCFAGTEVDWNTITMSEGDMLLYAKWEPIRHTVKIYLDATLTTQIGDTQSVAHKDFAKAPSTNVTNGNYVFQGWFYTDIVDGKKVEKAFVFTGIPIIDDIEIYAKWSSHTTVNYTIHYVLYQTGEKIADSTVGSAIAGNNKTFDAKAGEDLYDGFRTGYYPLVNSHTITMSVDGVHEFTFQYVYVESMPYAVRYVNKDTGETIHDTKYVMNNTLSVVTETFVKTDKMMPDAYQKRLVLSASGQDEDGDGVLDNNVITFYYHADEEHAYYRVVHYIENISLDSYREYRSVESVGVIGSYYTVDAITLTGFKFVGAMTRVNDVLTPVETNFVSAKLTAEGMTIELYYNRIDVEYTVKYVENGTDTEIYPSKVVTKHYGEQVVENALDLLSSGYTLVGDPIKVISLSSNPEHNVIKFIYVEDIVSIKYQIIGPDGCGSLSYQSENVLAISGKPNGSTPMTNNGFEFVGWYMDAACTEEADASLISPETNKLTPAKSNGQVWKDVTYYAKFISMETDLTIKTQNAQASDTDQVFIFVIKGKDGTESEGILLTVTLYGNSSKTITELPVGEYDVILESDWSWRYNIGELTKTTTLSHAASDNVIIFDVTRTNNKWLDGNGNAAYND